MTEPVIQPDKTVRIEKGDARAGEPWPKQELRESLAGRITRLAGQGVAVIIVTAVVVVVLMLAVAFVILVAGWAFNG